MSEVAPIAQGAGLILSPGVAGRLVNEITLSAVPAPLLQVKHADLISLVT